MGFQKGASLMSQLFSGITVSDVLFAAVFAYILTALIVSISNLRKLEQKRLRSMDYTWMDLSAFMEKCRESYPIETLYFHGKVFHRGMKIQITTLQKKVIEGELIGKNKIDQICIKTSNQIISHRIDRIEDIVLLSKEQV